MTSWNPNIPNPDDVPASDSTAQQLNNAVVDTAFAVDHVSLSLVTAQGFHKQLSLSNVGSSPYSVAGLQSYGYSKSLASNVRTFLEYQPAGGETFPGITPAVVPISPKSYCMFLPAAGVIATYYRKFNISSITQTNGAGGAPNTWVVVFNENIADANYFVSFSFLGTTSSSYPLMTAQAANTFAFAGPANITKLGFMVF